MIVAEDIEEMEVRELPLTSLVVSTLNVRKTLTADEDEPGINELANDIRTNGLINPLTVRKLGDQYEIIAGQRRFLAARLLGKETISCSIVDVDSQKAEEMSLVENVQRVQMTFADKVKTYSRLYAVYGRDITRVVNAVNVSRVTIAKYLKLAEMPEEIVNLLDSTGEDKLTLDVAVELTKIRPTEGSLMDVVQLLKPMSTQQRMVALRQIHSMGATHLADIADIRDDVITKAADIPTVSATPYVLDSSGRRIRIPEDMWSDVVRLIQDKKGGFEFI